MICPIVPAAPELNPGVTESWAVAHGRGPGRVVLDEVEVPALGGDLDVVDVVDCDWGALVPQAARPSVRAAAASMARTPARDVRGRVEATFGSRRVRRNRSRAPDLERLGRSPLKEVTSLVQRVGATGAQCWAHPVVSA